MADIKVRTIDLPVHQTVSQKVFKTLTQSANSTSWQLYFRVLFQPTERITNPVILYYE